MIRPGVRDQLPTELRAGPVQARHGGTDRDGQRVRDLLVGQSLQVREHDDDAGATRFTWDVYLFGAEAGKVYWPMPSICTSVDVTVIAWACTTNDPM